MAEFLKGNHLNSKLDEILENSERWLVLISPFIKFHSRIKEVLLSKKKIDKLKISVVFGKNEENIERSFSKEDFDFLSEFPNVEIRYESRLHAKYYANETSTLLSSMNLYEYSQNNNIEFGIYAKQKIFDNKKNSKNIDNASWQYFKGVMMNSELLYRKKPLYKEKLFGFKKEYTRSIVKVDKLNAIYLSTDKREQFNNVQEPNEKYYSSSKNESQNSYKNSVKTLSATKIAEKYNSKVSARTIQNLMESNGYVKGEDITDFGIEMGLVKKKYMGNNYISYPEDLEIFTTL